MNGQQGLDFHHYGMHNDSSDQESRFQCIRAPVTCRRHKVILLWSNQAQLGHPSQKSHVVRYYGLHSISVPFGFKCYLKLFCY